MTAKSKKAPEAETAAPDTAPSPPKTEGAEAAPAQPTPSEEAAPGAEPAPEPAAAPPEGKEPASELERELAVYPVREGAADPRWAVNIVWGWTGFTLFSLAFVLALLLLGYFYD